MADERFTYDDVRRALLPAALRHAISRGSAGPLLFFWILGTGALLTLLAAPILAAAYTAACAALAVPILRENVTDPAVRRALVGHVIAGRFPADSIADPALRREVARSVEAVTEMAVKIEDAERRDRQVDTLRSVFEDAAGLLALEFESAAQAEELERVLDFVNERTASRRAAAYAAPDRDAPGRPAPGGQGAGGRGRRRDADELRDANIAAVRGEAASAREMVATIGDRLETMLLQAFQIERETIDIVRAREAARESHEAVRRLQDVVDARRAAASRLATVLSGDEERYADDRG